MATDPRFGATMNPTDMTMEPKSKSSGCLKGCLIVAVVLGVLFVVGVLFLYFKGRDLAAGAIATVINQSVDQSSLPPQEKAEVKAEVDRAVQAFRDGKMTMEQLGRLMQELGTSPLMLIVAASSADLHLDRSGLSAEEKAAGHANLRRFKRGLFDKKIPQDAVQTVMKHIAQQDGGGQWKMKQQVSDEELRAMSDEAKAEADKAGVAAEPEEIDYSGEVKRMVDAAMGGN